MKTYARGFLFSVVLVAVAITAGARVDAQTSGAVRAANAFYTWYLSVHGNWTNLSGARGYLTPSLYASLEKLVSEQTRTQSAMLDFDPFSGAQSEAASYTIGSASGGASNATVPVNIRLRGGNGSTLVRVIVAHGSSGWKIDNFEYPGMGDLRRLLRDALK